jgi:hypothetical protein
MVYPGFTLEDYYSRPAIKIPVCQSKNVFESGVEFKFNKFGYRTIEFDSVPEDYFLVAGCSLTEGHGLDYEETWSYLVSEKIGLPVINLAKGSGNAQFCNQVISRWIPIGHTPKFVIVQWPHIYRSLVWKREQGMFVLNNNKDSVYVECLKSCDNNFFETWITSIIRANEHCKHHGIPILNICLEEIETIPKNILKILSDHGIDLHLDEKLDGKTWFFDNKAKDNMHHSVWCTEKWAQRIITLLDSDIKYK